MSTDSKASLNDDWAPALGAGVVNSLLSLIGLNAIGGWPWVANFIESSAPAWIQAVGSVATIIAAVLIVKRQHALEIERIRSAQTSEQQRRARALRVVFFSAARTCEDVSRRIGSPHQKWDLLSEELVGARARLMSIDPMLVPGGGLLLLVEECAMRLRTSATVVKALETPRPEKVQEAVRIAVMAAARECWLGLYEATGLEAKLSRGEGNDSKPYAFDDFEDSRKRLDKIRAEFVRDADSIRNTESTYVD